MWKTGSSLTTRTLKPVDMNFVRTRFSGRLWSNPVTEDASLRHARRSRTHRNRDRPCDFGLRTPSTVTAATPKSQRPDRRWLWERSGTETPPMTVEKLFRRERFKNHAIAVPQLRAPGAVPGLGVRGSRSERRRRHFTRATTCGRIRSRAVSFHCSSAPASGLRAEEACRSR
jgi:hypothetical protein